MLFIYLDQCHWIGLGKAEVGKADGKCFAPVLEMARAAVRDGRACFPISAAHIKETLKATPQQRKVLAHLIADLSQGNVFRTPRVVVEHELRHAVRRVFGLSALEFKLSPFGRGIEDVFNFDLAAILKDKSPEWVQLMRQSLDSPEAWIDLLSQDDKVACQISSTRMGAIAQKFAEGREDDRQLWGDSDKNEVRRMFVARVHLHFFDAMQTAINEVGKHSADLEALGANGLVDLWLGIPCVRSLIEFEEALHFEKSKRWKANDLSDLEFLSLAIPPCDIVVTEKFWTQHAKRRGLDRAFQTTILADLKDLKIESKAL